MASISYYAGTGASASNPNVSGGGVAWVNPGNILTSNNVYATISLNGTTTPESQYLKATNFGFNIPAGSTINGVSCTFERNTGYTNGTQDTEVYLLKSGVISGTNRSAGAYWPTSEELKTFGSPTDLWGTTLSVSDINNTNFGVVLACQYGDVYGGSTVIGSVDSVQITVYYTEPPTPTPTQTPTPTTTKTLSATPTPTTTKTLSATPTPTTTKTLSATPTATNTLTQTPTNTPTTTKTLSATPTPTTTKTLSATPASTLGSTPTPTSTNTPTPTTTKTLSATPTPTTTKTLSATPTQTNTATPTATNTPTTTKTLSATPTPTTTKTLSATPTPTTTKTLSATPTPTTTTTLTATPTSTPGGTPSVTPTQSSVYPGLKFGNLTIQKVYLGTTRINSIRAGNNRVL